MGKTNHHFSCVPLCLYQPSAWRFRSGTAAEGKGGRIFVVYILNVGLILNNGQMRKFGMGLFCLMLFGQFALPTNPAIADTSETSNGVTITLAGGNNYYFAAEGIWSYNQAIQVQNSNDTQEVSLCNVSYSLFNGANQIVRNGNDDLFVPIAPKSTGYATLFNIYNDASISPKWTYLSLTGADCQLNRSSGKDYRSTGAVIYKLLPENVSGNAIYTPIIFTNTSHTSTSHALVNVAMYSPNGGVSGTSIISGSNSNCYNEINLAPGATLQCQIVRFNYDSFSNYLIQLWGYSIPGDSPPTSIISTPSSSKTVCSSGSGLHGVCLSYPNWRFRFCTSNQKGTLYSLQNAKWVLVTSILGTKNSLACGANYPYLIDASGTTKVKQGSVNMKIVFTRSSNNPGFTQTFTLKVT